jgi:hypothetical protein
MIEMKNALGADAAQIPNESNNVAAAGNNLDLDKFHALLAEDVNDKQSGWTKNTSVDDKKNGLQATIHS